MKDKIDEINQLATYLLGAADSCEYQNPKWSEKLKKVSEHLETLARHTCAHGYICRGGHQCTSDHK